MVSSFPNKAKAEVKVELRTANRSWLNLNLSLDLAYDTFTSIAFGLAFSDFGR